MLPTLRDVLALPELRRGEPLVRAGDDRLEEPVRWVHVSEVSDIAHLLEGGELILTTGIALPGSPQALRAYVDELVTARVCGVVVELGRRFRGTLPVALVDAAAAAGLPLVELHRETKFVVVTQAVHTLILAARMRELVSSDERQRHRTVLTALLIGAGPPDELAARAAALGVPLTGRALTGVAVRSHDGPVEPAALRDVADRAARALAAVGVPALVGLLDDDHVGVLLAQDRADRAPGALRRLADALHASPGRRRAESLVVAAGVTVPDVARAAVSLSEAVRVAGTAASLAPQEGWFTAADLRLHGLVHELHDDPRLAAYVERELGAVLARPDAGALLAVLSAYCGHGGNKTDAAAALFVSRASLYDRLRKLGRVLDADLDDPEVVLSLHFALLAHGSAGRPDLAVRGRH